MSSRVKSGPVLTSVGTKDVLGQATTRTGISAVHTATFLFAAELPRFLALILQPLV